MSERKSQREKKPLSGLALEISESAPRELLELGEFFHEFSKESSRGAALIAAALLDERLKTVLMAFLLESKISAELFNGLNAPLGTFSSRASLAYSLGLIQKHEFDEISLIRKIRNEFGHKWRAITFNDSPIADLCRNLPWLGPSDVNKDDPRRRFNFAVAILLADLMWREKLVARERCTARRWPNTSRK